MNKRNRILAILITILFGITQTYSQYIILKSKDLRINIDRNGLYQSINVDGKQVLGDGKYPLMTACVNGKLVMPEKVVSSKGKILVYMADKSVAELRYKETPNCVTIEVAKVPDVYDAVLFGPVKVTINDVVGDVVGVVQGNGVAVGIQSMNIKTNAGIPTEYISQVADVYGNNGNGAELSVGKVPSFRLAAVDVSDGAIFQLSCRNRTRMEKRTVMQLEDMMVLPAKGEDALIKGAKIAIFGSKAESALQRIGDIEIEQGLPHPLFDGEWGKTARSAMRSYLITSFSENDFDFVLDKAEKAGFKYVYHSEPLRTGDIFIGIDSL